MENKEILDLLYEIFNEGYVLGACDYGAGDIDTDRVKELFKKQTTTAIQKACEIINGKEN